MGQCIIKFKAKRLGDGKWVEGYYVKKVAHNVVSKYDVVEDGEEHFIFGMAKDDVQPYWYEVDHTTVCQFTGLKDCDGNEIYEGDIIDFDICPCSVVWANGVCAFCLKNITLEASGTTPLGVMLDYYNNYRVLGSIYDSKLKEKKNIKDK